MTEPSAPGSPASPQAGSQPSAPPPAPPAAAAVPPTEAPQAPVQEGQKVKVRMPYQRACNEKDAKGKLCAGHLKRWYGYGEDIKKKYGENPEVYRCEYCHTLYLPAPGYEARTGTLQF